MITKKQAIYIYLYFTYSRDSLIQNVIFFPLNCGSKKMTYYVTLNYILQVSNTFILFQQNLACVPDSADCRKYPDYLFHVTI